MGGQGDDPVRNVSVVVTHIVPDVSAYQAHDHNVSGNYT